MEPDTNQKSLTVTLPFELLSHIVNLNSDDKATLYHIALTSKALCADVIKHLYASSPLLLLSCTDPNAATSGIKFLSTISNSTEYALLVKKVTILIPHSCNCISVCVVVNNLKKMSNITNLSIAPFYGKDGVPGGLLDYEIPYKLRTLTWRGRGTLDFLASLCDLLNSHRDTLEMVDMGLDYGLRTPVPVAKQLNSVIAMLISAVQRFWRGLSILSRSRTERSDRAIEAPPLTRLHTVKGSLEILAIFLPLVVSPSSIRNLVIIPPGPSIQVSRHDPKFAHFPRIFDFLHHSSLTSLTVDVSLGWEIDLEAFMQCVPSLETLAIQGLKLSEPIVSAFLYFNFSIALHINRLARAGRCCARQYESFIFIFSVTK
ncbi:hypothetical protein CVT24_008955 [Panaeolus cyanescens]|uniref:Uncharacterized protein n=1 Tax=Panaeolus cyanescens TaxID=181874 RepID=A0A409YAX0_9AGAR|nr:hypothetical protein CVT24_008955 [Panaeolus cyanescens]